MTDPLQPRRPLSVGDVLTPPRRRRYDTRDQVVDFLLLIGAVGVVFGLLTCWGG